MVEWAPGEPQRAYQTSRNGSETIVFLPALGTTGDMWAPQVAQFSPTYRVVTIDIAGHDAGSTRSEQPSLADYADGVREILSDLGAERVHVVGISLGGMIAQELALRFRETCSTLTLVSTTGRYPQAAREAIASRAAEVERTGTASIVEDRVLAWFTERFRQTEAAVVDAIRQQLLTADPRAYAQAARAAAGVDTLDRLGALQSPVLVVEGASDGSMPPGCAQSLLQAIPEAFHAQLDASHLCSLEQPHKFNRRLSDFLSLVGGRSAPD